MSKWLAVVALVLLVLSGAMGLRNLVVGECPDCFPPSTAHPLQYGRMAQVRFRRYHHLLVVHVRANGPGPIPPIPPPTGWSRKGRMVRVQFRRFRHLLVVTKERMVRVQFCRFCRLDPATSSRAFARRQAGPHARGDVLHAGPG